MSSPTTRRLSIWLAGAMALGLAGCGSHQEVRPPLPAAAGERFLVRPASIPDMKPVAATVTSRDVAEARARIGGVLVRLAVREGDMVRTGQVIGVVSDSRIGLETRAYDAQISAAQAESVRAQADLSRIRDLYEHGVYAKARLDQVQATARAAESALAGARAQRAASAEAGAQGVIRAPADGRVLKADVPAGSVVSPGQAVATITAGPILLRVEIPEGQAAGLKVGQIVPLASEDVGPAAASARVVQVYPAVSAGQVIADLAAPGLDGGGIGRRVRLSLPVGERKALVVPGRFIVSRFGVDYARLAARDGSASEVPVQLAPGPAAGQVEVLSGLAPGDVLVRPGAAR